MGRKNTCWENVKLSKGDSFPSFFVIGKNGHATKIQSADINGWLNRLEGWAASHSAPYICEFAKILAPISADGSKREPLFPNEDPTWELLDTPDAHKALIKLANTTKLGQLCIGESDDKN